MLLCTTHKVCMYTYTYGQCCRRFVEAAAESQSTLDDVIDCLVCAVCSLPSRSPRLAQAFV